MKQDQTSPLPAPGQRVLSKPAPTGRPPTGTRRGRRLLLGITVVLTLVGHASASMALSTGTPARTDSAQPHRLAEAESSASAVTLPGHGRWSWPIEGAVRVTRPFLAPPHAYGAGHRGIDLTSLADGSDVLVRAPADGVIAFVGTVVDRPLLTIDHGDGLVTTLEPVNADLTVGTRVHAAEEVGALAAGGHAGAGELHFGVRLNGEYINPLLLLGGVPRAILLPCCSEAGGQ